MKLATAATEGKHFPTPIEPRQMPKLDVAILLKEETAAEHRRLEEQLDLLNPAFSLQEYTALLERFFGFYRRWEPVVFPILETCDRSLTAGRTKLSLLEQDLHELGVDPTRVAEVSNLPGINDLAQALGSGYVLEGSTLGGQILARHFEQSLKLPDRMLNYFRCYEANTGPMWAQYRKALVTFTPAGEEDRVVRSARLTFECLSAWLVPERAA